MCVRGGEEREGGKEEGGEGGKERQKERGIHVQAGVLRHMWIVDMHVEDRS